MFTILFGVVLPWLLIVLGGWIGLLLVRQNGRILLRLESIEELLGQSLAGQANLLEIEVPGIQQGRESAHRQT